MHWALGRSTLPPCLHPGPQEAAALKFYQKHPGRFLGILVWLGLTMCSPRLAIGFEFYVSKQIMWASSNLFPAAVRLRSCMPECCDVYVVACIYNPGVTGGGYYLESSSRARRRQEMGGISGFQSSPSLSLAWVVPSASVGISGCGQGA